MHYGCTGMRISHERFIVRTYCDVLGREPDAEGFQHYLKRLSRNEIDRSALVLQILRSEEFAIQVFERGWWHRLKIIARVAPRLIIHSPWKILSLRPPVADVNDRLGKLQYFHNAEVPNLAEEYRAYDAGNSFHRQLVLWRYGITVKSQNRKNRLYLHHKAKRFQRSVTLEFKGKNNVVILDRHNGLNGTITFQGNNGIALFYGMQGRAGISATFHNNSVLIWGKRSFSFGVQIAVASSTVCTIGDDCLFSSGITIRTTDHHSIIDLDSWEVINRPADVTFGKHIWVGQDCLILKGAEIGDGSIIGARSLVIRSIPSCELWGGSPARMIRRNVSWIGSHPNADLRDVESMCNLLRIEPPINR